MPWGVAMKGAEQVALPDPDCVLKGSEVARLTRLAAAGEKLRWRLEGMRRGVCQADIGLFLQQYEEDVRR